MADPITSVPLLLPVEERSPLISLAKGEIAPEMYNSIGEMRAFKGISLEAEILGDMIKELVIHALSNLNTRNVT